MKLFALSMINMLAYYLKYFFSRISPVASGIWYLFHSIVRLLTDARIMRPEILRCCKIHKQQQLNFQQNCQFCEFKVISQVISQI